MYTVRLNSQLLNKNSEDKLDAIKLGRKQALKLEHPEGFIHIEILDDSSNVVHRDLVLAEEIERLKSDTPRDIMGPIQAKEFDVDTILKKKKTRKLAELNQFVIFGDELYKISDVHEDSVTAKPVKEKIGTVNNKKIKLQRKSISLPVDTNVLTEEQVKEFLKKSEDDNIRKDEDAGEQSVSDNSNTK
jgi:hypothetical protein